MCHPDHCGLISAPKALVNFLNGFTNIIRHSGGARPPWRSMQATLRPVEVRFRCGLAGRFPRLPVRQPISGSS